MNTMDKIQEKTLNMKIVEEKRIRELIKVINIMGTVKSANKEGELTNTYSVWFKTYKEANKYQEALNDGKVVLVTLKEIGNRWSVIDAEIRKPNVEIPDSTLEEQRQEVMDLGNDY
jgi:hypothetical protein